MGDQIDEAEVVTDEGRQARGRQGATGHGGYVPYLDGGAGRPLPADGIDGEPAWGTTPERENGLGEGGRRQTRTGLPSRSHASFFSGAGGVDIGLEQSGRWHTVSFCEFAKYPSSILADRWPGVPNLGDITALVGDERGGDVRQDRLSPRESFDRRDANAERVFDPAGWHSAVLWTGGFPCQDISIAGKRHGLAGERSGLAFAFLELLDRYRDVPERWVVLENVQGLLSSHGGRDLAALTGSLGDLGYGWGYRCLDGQYFDVPQRRIRVFLVAHTIGGRIDYDGPAEVLALGTRCRRHPPTGIGAGAEAAADVGGSVAGSLREHVRPGSNTDFTVIQHGVLADGATSTRTISAAFGHHGYTLGSQDVDGGLLQLAPAVPASLANGVGHNKDDFIWPMASEASDATGNGVTDGVAARSYDQQVLLPPKLDSHRYKACGNGVIAPKAEWLGGRIAEYMDEHPET